MRQFALAAFLAFFALPSNAAERWETLPPTPAPIATDRSGEAEANGIKIHYAIYGQGSPVIFLHGGLANTDYWGQPGSSRRRTSYRDPDGQSRPWPQHPRCAPLRL
jgi:hypothetical protein